MASSLNLCVAILLVAATVEDPGASTTAATHALEWTPATPEEQTVYACAKSQVTLNWNYTIASGEKVEDVKWYYDNGHSSQMVAFILDGTFMVMPGFSGRVRHFGNAGLVIDNVVPSDRGNYSVNVHAVHDQGTFSNLRGNVELQMDVPPVLKGDGNLTASQSTEAAYNNVTDTWHVQLKCGEFTELGHPPVDVVWETPSGASVPSTYHKDGYFYLLLDSSADGGDYSCHVSSHCVRENDPLQKQVATVGVDELKARMSLIEAQQMALQRKMKVETNQQTVELKQQLENLTAHVQRLQTQLDNCACGAHADPPEADPVSFHARLTTDQEVNYTGPIALQTVYTNEGGAYDSLTGIFTVPTNGTYALFTAVGTTDPGSYAILDIMADQDWVCHTASKHTDDHESSSCQAVVHLNKGQRVWVQAHGNSRFSFSLTFFGGFLINADK